ncbi:MAG: hypothetical protein H0X42_04355 [Solirubrobacterales bacterium]|nr:hypothetical protein [Solirubrobacterales bacterium]
MSGADLSLAVSVFLACAVEAVEALTIVLAVGSTRSWRSAFSGVLAALLVLAVLIAALGPAIVSLPIDVLRIAVGGLLLIFGLQWLRKAILRAAGLKSMHDELAIFEAEAAAAGSAGVAVTGFDGYSFTIAFKGVLLEGLEVAFIVLTFGANQGNVGLAAVAAGAAVVLVVLAGFAARAPLARVPENSMKFVVGVLLSTFGIFWGAEGAGASWPGGEAALPVLALAIFAAAALMVRDLRLGRPELVAGERPWRLLPAIRQESAKRVRPVIRRAALGVWEFVVGDDWRTAAGVVVVLGATALVAAVGLPAWWLAPIGALASLYLSLRRALVRPPGS